jgi:hypothetical protein
MPGDEEPPAGAKAAALLPVAGHIAVKAVLVSAKRGKCIMRASIFGSYVLGAHIPGYTIFICGNEMAAHLFSEQNDF